MEEVESFRRIGWYRLAFGSVRNIFSELLGIVVAKNAVAYACSNFGISVFSAKNATLVHSSLTVLSGRADASALSMKILRKSNNGLISPRKVFWAISLHPILLLCRGVPLCVKERIYWNRAIIAGVATVEKRSIYASIAQYTSTTHLLKHYLEEDGTYV